MNHSLEQAIQLLRELPEYEQDNVADAMFAYLASDERQYQQGHSGLDRNGTNQ
jgi:hypothetical protein